LESGITEKMRTRYFRDTKGKPTIKAVVYERSDHSITRSNIDLDARKICTRLAEQGHEAYIVGGAVRDLLLGRIPKDFDIATDASPSRVKRLFRNSRVIGKRFRLVHVYFRDGKIHEVATFRAPESGDRNHVFGTLNEDVMRRDFSLNALYYDPEEETVIDFVNGVKDIRSRVVKSVLPLNTSFSEDPVRMLRAVKYAALTGMRISPQVGRKIKKQASLLSTASVSRLSEELYKILNSRNSEIILRLMDRYKLLDQMLPHLNNNQTLRESMFLNLAKLDQKMLSKEQSRGVMILHLCEDSLGAQGIFEGEGRNAPMYADVVRSVKDLLNPLVQPKRDVEEAVRLMFSERGLKLPRKRPRHPEVRVGEHEAGDRPRRRRRRPKRKTSEPGETPDETPGDTNKD
jgi:poly(A) polymerase